MRHGSPARASAQRHAGGRGRASRASRARERGSWAGGVDEEVHIARGGRGAAGCAVGGEARSGRRGARLLRGRHGRARKRSAQALFSARARRQGTRRRGGVRAESPWKFIAGAAREGRQFEVFSRSRRWALALALHRAQGHVNRQSTRRQLGCSCPVKGARRAGWPASAPGSVLARSSLDADFRHRAVGFVLTRSCPIRAPQIRQRLFAGPQSAAAGLLVLARIRAALRPF